MKHRGLKFLSLLLTLALLVGLLPRMSLTALAWDGDPYASLLNTTTVVKFDNKDWYLIENNSTAVDAGTVILLSKECVAASQYNSSGIYYVEYASSTVKTAVDNYYTNSISSNVKTAIVDNKMFLLTTDQANTIKQANPEVLKCNKASDVNAWWLCSPGDSHYLAACVYGDSYVDAGGCGVGTTLGVRPALKLDLSKVTFDSTSKTFTVNAATYTMTFKPGEGATGNDQQLTATAGVDFELPTAETWFTAPEGKVFAGWKDDATDTVYKPGDKIQGVDKDYTFTAQWKESSSGGNRRTGGSGSGFDLVFNIPGVDNSWEYAPGYAPQLAYRVSLAPMQGGSAALGLTTGDSGAALNVYPSTTVFVFPNANPGYVLDKIVWSLIDGSASYDITEAKNFVMPAMDVVVYVTFRPAG